MSNVKKIKSDYEKTLKIVSLKALKDKNLTPAEKGILYMMLYAFNIKNGFTTKQMSKYLNISEPTLIKYLKKYKALGYLKENILSDYNE